ncbi:MAG: hypothetical protein HQL48_07550 [Gammaproteobacteria bacterium]|nr:hypothetical protein [Gammaproteobacteria bacterium]
MSRAKSGTLAEEQLSRATQEAKAEAQRRAIVVDVHGWTAAVNCGF